MNEELRPLINAKMDNSTLIMGLSIALIIIGASLYAIYYGYTLIIQGNNLGIAAAALGAFLLTFMGFSFYKKSKVK